MPLVSLAAAFAEIQQFWPTGLPFAFGHGGAAAGLAAGFGQPLSAELVTYLDTVAPAHDVQRGPAPRPASL